MDNATPSKQYLGLPPISFPAISDYGVIGNYHTVALVSLNCIAFRALISGTIRHRAMAEGYGYGYGIPHHAWEPLYVKQKLNNEWGGRTHPEYTI